MNTVKIDEETDAKLTGFSKKSKESKTKILRIILRNLTDKQFRDILISNIDHNMGKDEDKIDWDEDGPKTIGPNEDDDDDQKFTSYGDPICKECGMSYDECDCADEIEWEDDDEEEED